MNVATPCRASLARIPTDSAEMVLAAIEVIALVVAAINNCDFCLNAHAGALRRKYGYDDEA